jgi:hypothetical protein
MVAWANAAGAVNRDRPISKPVETLVFIAGKFETVI